MLWDDFFSKSPEMCVSQFLYVSKPGREEIAAEVYEDEVDLRRAGSYLNSSFHSAWSEPGVDPDDFRVKPLIPLANEYNSQKVEENHKVTHVYKTK